MTIVYASMPRILYGISRNGHFLGPLSKWFGTVHSKYRTPWTPIIVTAVAYSWAAIAFGDVVDLIFTAAYVWLLLYVVYHVLVFVSSFTNPDVHRPFKLPLWVPALGVVGTIYLWWKAFEGAHSFFGPRALWMIGVAAVVAIVGVALEKYSGVTSHLEEEVHQEA
jgi:amino acid transporter